MAFSRGPSIVKDGLVMYLDAANVKSYPGTGTIWNDLSGNRIAFGIITTTGFARPDSGVFLTPNTWHYIVGTYDGVNMRIYEDTILRTTLAKTGTIVNANVSLNIGRSFSTEEMPVNIALTQIYNRALTSAEILQNYNATKSRFNL